MIQKVCKESMVSKTSTYSKIDLAQLLKVSKKKIHREKLLSLYTLLLSFLTKGFS